MINPTAFVVYEALSRLGWETQDAAGLAEGVRRLALGLPAEDEISVILSWLGRCHVLHKLDQLQVPVTSRVTYRVPDLLAIFDDHGREVPVLIEVKKSSARKLSWRPDFFNGLRRYGHALGLPVLVAWKIVPLDIWTLVDLEHLQLAHTNFHLTRDMAMRNNLLGVLGGDFAVVFKPGLGLHLHLQVLETLREAVHEDGSTQEVIMQVNDAYFRSPAGERRTRLGSGLWPLFLAAQPTEQTTKTDDGYRLSFEIAEGQFGPWAHTALTTLLMWQGNADESDAPFLWREVLQAQRFPMTAAELAAAASTGIQEGVVQYVLNVVPNVRPAFLADA